jgi:hypothetical protein
MKDYDVLERLLNKLPDSSEKQEGLKALDNIRAITHSHLSENSHSYSDKCECGHLYCEHDEEGICFYLYNCDCSSFIKKGN